MPAKRASLTAPVPALAPAVQCYAELEIKHGLLQVADTLHFLHTEAGLVMKGLCPSAILITQTGAPQGRRGAFNDRNG